MPHQYKLIYFNGRGRAEPSRLILAFAGANYDDNRIERADWPALKPKYAFGQVPVLEIDNGKVILSQSKAIARYLGNEFNLVPKDHILSGKADMLVDGHDDILKHFAPWFQEQDPAKKKEIWKKLETDVIAPFLKLYEKFLTDSGTGYFVTNSVTWADLYLFEALHSLKTASPHLFDSHPKLVEFVNKIANEPKIKAWIEKRPNTPF
jgi:glutathione S-transferase